MSLLVSFLAVIACVSSYWPPEQIHISLGVTPDIMHFNWLTWDYPISTNTYILAGLSPHPSTFTMNISGDVHLFTDPNSQHRNRSIHSVTLSNLESSTTYFYQIGDFHSGWSTVFHFKTGPDSKTLNSSLPHSIVFYGDMGTVNNEICSAITELAMNDAMDVLIHIGDFAYNLFEENGSTGDTFMNDIQPISTIVPYMTTMGNHEQKYNFSHYSQRFRGQPIINHSSANANKFGVETVWTTSGELPNNWYFSWNYGLIHFISLSSEIYFDFPFMISDQYQWLIKDLQIANDNRTLAPWIIVYHHRLLYCSAIGSECESQTYVLRNGVLNGSSFVYGLEDVYYEYGVDIVYNGHVHNYERMFDIYKNTTSQSTVDMPSTMYVANGDAGNREGHHLFNDQQPEWSAYRTTAYSYSYLEVQNATHIHLQQILADDELPPEDQGSILDDVWLVQHKHGSFAENYGDRKVNGHGHSVTYDPYSLLGIEMKVEDEECREKDRYPVEYISDDKEDYRGVPGVYF